MKAFWLNKKHNPNLIVFFAGWSFDENPFKSLKYDRFDVLIVYDYNDLKSPKELSETKNYESKILLSWSMGVFASYVLRDLFVDFDKKIAINGTVTPVDNEYGIPVRMFELTLKYCKKSLDNQFYRNIFLTDAEYEKYCKNPVVRSIQSRVEELSSLYELIKKSDFVYKKFYDFAYISNFDKIIPSKNQINSHNKNKIPFLLLPFGHCLFYNFTCWSEIINADRLQKY